MKISDLTTESKTWVNGVGDVFFEIDSMIQQTSGLWKQNNEITRVYRNNGSFEDVLTWVGIQNFESQSNIIFYSRKFNTDVFMSLKDLDKAMQTDPIFSNKELEGLFTFIKHGSSYFIKYVGRCVNL